MTQSTDTAVLAAAFAATRAAYATTRAAYTAAGYDARYPLGADWVDNLKLLVPLITDDSDPLSKLRRVHQTVMYTIASSQPETKARMVDWYVAYLTGRGVALVDLEPGLAESDYANPDNTVVRDGRRLSPDFLRTLILTLEIEAHCVLPSGPFAVLELGAGYGGLARTFKLRYPGATYVIVDIPETLFFSSTFLRLSFPEARVLDVTAASDLETPLDRFDFVFIPTMFADGLRGRPFTLFCNTASLGEMTNSVVRHWMDFVERGVNVRYFFGLNRFLNTVVPVPDHPRLEENRASVSFDSGWCILHWELDPPFTRCPYLETIVSQNLEVIAERAGVVDADANVHRSQALVQSVQAQDWFTHPTVRGARILLDEGDGWPDPGMRASALLTPDLTMAGPLFALWESIRLHPTRTNVEMMLQYLDLLRRRWPFEETYFYAGLLERLTGTPGAIGRPRPVAMRVPTLAKVVRRFSPPGLRRKVKRIARRLYYGKESP